MADVIREYRGYRWGRFTLTPEEFVFCRAGVNVYASKYGVMVMTSHMTGKEPTDLIAVLHLADACHRALAGGASVAEVERMVMDAGEEGSRAPSRSSSATAKPRHGGRCPHCAS